MKHEIISEISKIDSNIRVIFATSALGMAEYCKNDSSCLRSLLLQHFKHKAPPQQKCCIICHPETDYGKHDHVLVREKVQRKISEADLQKLSQEFNNLLADLDANLTDDPPREFFGLSMDTKEIAEKFSMILDNVTEIENEDSLLGFGLWDEDVSKKAYELIQIYTTELP
ncbi:uncharacterized protein LOC130655039 [Hydractinia symbiolongicarpus]|uniref:uncharacterized protein LOC130655039 n=1 Tax=Hydractinia symbiolongicarpus TaxID=13093 RepID=UPI00254EE120|nr:uncharacterized protein LOC130655039 [Hydractinia symbiolongicarpus]